MRSCLMAQDRAANNNSGVRGAVWALVAARVPEKNHNGLVWREDKKGNPESSSALKLYSHRTAPRGGRHAAVV